MVTVSPKIIQIIPAEGWRALFAVRSGEEEQTYTMPLACWALVEHSAEEFEEYDFDEDEFELDEEDLNGEEEESDEDYDEDEDEDDEEGIVYRAVEGIASFIGGGTCFVEDLPGYICYLEPGEDPAKRYQAMLDSGLINEEDIPAQESPAE